MATLVSAAVILLLDSAVRGDGVPLLQAVTFGVSIGLVAAALTCTVVSWTQMMSAREALGFDYATQKAIRRVVVRNGDDELTEEGQRRAAAYAAIMAGILPFQLAQLVMVITGVWLQQLWNLRSGLTDGFDAFATALVVGYPVLLAVFLPFSIRQVRHVRRYAARHTLPPAVAADRST